MNEDPDTKEIYDYDQGLKFKDRQSYVDAMFNNKENVSTYRDSW